MIKKICSYSVLFCLSSLGLLAVGSLSGDNLTVSKTIHFEIEIDSALNVDLEPVNLDFGTLVRGTNQTRVAKGDLKFKSAFNKDVKVSITYDPTKDQALDNPNYAMYKIKHENVKEAEVTENDSLDVYIKRVKDVIMKQGDMTIPITGEIRQVGKEARLGKYSDKIDATVFVNYVDPTEQVTPEGRLRR